MSTLSYFAHNDTTKAILAKTILEIEHDNMDGLELIYNARNRIFAFDSPLGRLSLKAFKQPILIQRFIYSYLRPSKAKRSYEHAMRLKEKGFGTPEPLAYAIEWKHGLLAHSYYLCRLIENAKDLRDLMGGESKDPTLMKAVAQFIAQLHKAGIWHTDLSPGNVLYRVEASGSYLFYLVDLNRMKFYSEAIVGDKAIENMKRLALDREASTELAKAYAEQRSIDQVQCIDRLNEATDRFFMKRVYRHARKLQVREEKRYSKAFFRRQYINYLCVRCFRKLCHSKRLWECELALYEKYFRRGDIRQALRIREGYPPAPVQQTKGLDATTNIKRD